jgi:RecB family endonuclease NucS
MTLDKEERARVRALISDGRSNEEISDETGLSILQIRAVRAHITMGTYEDDLDTADEADVDEALETTFGLERDLQQALWSSIEQLDPDLRAVAKEERVASGRIDITAEAKDGTTVVIELKTAEADRDAVAQLLSYMGDKIADGKSPVRGILVAGGFTSRAISAARATGNVELRKYSFKFSFESVN